MSSGKILLVNQSTSHLFRGLGEQIKRKFPEFDVYVLAGSFEPNESGEATVEWLKGPLLVRHPASKRLWSWSTFSLRFIWESLTRRYRLIILTTNPPFVPWLLGLLNVFLNRPYLLIEYDIYPDVLARMGTLKPGSVAYRVMRKWNAFAMRKADAVVTLGQDMAQHLQAQCDGNAPKIDIITSWADTAVYRPMPRQENAFAVKHGLENKFVVMYSGAFGATHDMDSILEAAQALKSVPEIIFVLIGKGTRFEEIEKTIQRLQLPNIILLPWQPLSVVPSSLAAADAHIVSLDALYSGISFPSKFYTSIAVGASIIAVADSGTDLARVVREERLGYVARPGAASDLVEIINKLRQSPAERHSMGERGRNLAVSVYDESVCSERYLNLIQHILEGKPKSVKKD